MLLAEELLKQVQSLNKDVKYREVIELLKDELLETYQNASLFAQKAIAFSNLEEFELAKLNAKKALLIDPLHAIANNCLGHFYISKKEYEKAKECYDIAIKTDPGYSHPYYNLGVTYYGLEEYKTSIEFYNKYLEFKPDDDDAYLGLGIAFEKLKEYKKAKEFYNKAITVNPVADASYYNLANVHYVLKEYESAKEFYNKYIDLTKDHPDYFTELAKSRIIELKKLIESSDYKAISELVNKIKGLLLFKDECITHYTGLSITKLLILENSLFRLSEGAFLNDTSEGRELFDFLPAFFAPSGRTNNAEAKPFAPKPFVGSFVSQKKHDDLTLWRMYGKENKDEARGCAITIEREKLLENLKKSLLSDSKTYSPEKINEEFNFYRVAYRNQDNKDNKDCFTIPGAPGEEQTLNQLMSDLLDTVSGYLKKEIDPSDIQNLIELLNSIAFLFKIFEYQYEHEVRLVVTGTEIPKIVDNSFSPPRVYINLVSIKPLIERITLGPKVEKAEEWASSFYYSLDREDLHPEILISHLPFK